MREVLEMGIDLAEICLVLRDFNGLGDVDVWTHSSNSSSFRTCALIAVSPARFVSNGPCPDDPAMAEVRVLGTEPEDDEISGVVRIKPIPSSLSGCLLGLVNN